MLEFSEGSSIVLCQSSHAYLDRPIYVYWDDQRLPVVDILNRSRQLDGDHFHVCVEDGRAFRLVYFRSKDVWRVQCI